MNEPPRKKKDIRPKKEGPDFDFNLKYDRERGLQVEISPEGLDKMFEGMGQAINDSKLGDILFGKQHREEEEDGEGVQPPFWAPDWNTSGTPPDIGMNYSTSIQGPPIKVEEEGEGGEDSMERVPLEPTVKVEEEREPTPNWPPHSPYLGDDCEHPEVVLIIDENEMLDMMKFKGYRGVKLDWQGGGHICTKCLKKVF